MKRLFYFCGIGLALATLVTSCQMTEEVENPIAPDALYGYWKEQTMGEAHYLRFMTEKEDTKDGEYLFGYEFYPDTEGEDIQESDLWEQYHGNGWFKYKLTANSKKETTLHEIIFMDNKGAEIPKTYVIQSLTATTLSYKDGNLPYTFTKTTQP